MASSTMARNRTPRTGSAKWGRPRPVTVSHPMVGMSLDLDLTVTGMPTPGLESSRMLQWPPEHLLKTGRSMTGKMTRSTARMSDNDLVELVKQQLPAGLEGIRQLFRSKDPLGTDAIVTREGLFQIVTALVGPVKREQFDSFLKTINLHWRSTISFDEFIVRFFDNPAVAKYALAQKVNKPQHLEENLRSLDMMEWCPFTTAPHAFVVFKKKLQNGEVNIRDVLPPACFLTTGRVIQPQLREALAQVGVRLTDSEFANIWYKFDADNNGSVPIKRFYKTLELSPNGLPKPVDRVAKSATVRGQPKGAKSVQKRCKTEMKMTSTTQENSSMSISKVDSVEIRGNQAEIITDQSGRDGHIRGHSSEKVKQEVTTMTREVETTKTTTTTRKTTTQTDKREEQLVSDDQLSSHVRSLIQQKKAAPQFTSILDQLHFKFEETYRNLLSAFHLFDFMNDGYVTKIDFRRILQEFGFNITALDLEAFLQKAGISVVQGLINYNQFLQKFQSKGSSSIASKVCMRNESQDQYKRIETEETLRAEEMETAVSNCFQADYLKLLGMLKQNDKNNTGIVPAMELRNAINSVLRINMSDYQFEELIERLSQKSTNGTPVVNYNNFLDLFNEQPGHWNRLKNGEFLTHKYYLGDLAPATPVLRLQEKAKTWMAPPTDRNKASEGRVAEIKRELSKLFTDRFHVFDKSFQEMDRRRTGYMSKWQFGALIKLCGITLTVHDLDFLWATLDTEADNNLSYATLVKTFTSGSQRKLQEDTAEKTTRSKTATSRSKTGENGKTARVQGFVPYTVAQPQVVTGSAKERRLSELLTKVKDDVLSRWDVLHSIFLSLDRDGYSTISVQDMRDISYKMKFPLGTAERNELSNFFDLHTNGWFNYLSFLHAVRKHASAKPKGCNVLSKRLHGKAGPTSMAITIRDFLSELKAILLKKHKTLRGAFKFFDHNRNSYIEEAEMRKSLSMLGYSLSNRDFIDIMEFFDRSHANRLSYEDFKNTLLIV